LTFKILISTVNDKFMKRKYKPNSDLLIINQLIGKNKSEYNEKYIKSFLEKGLSKSRNRAIDLCDSDIALISDDDVEYVENVEEIIKKAFEDNPDADIITFQALRDKNTPFKNNYKKEKFWHNIYTLAKVSSIEIAFRVNKIKNKNIRFDENFGLGSHFPTGEEYIFLTDALKSGLKILYIPIPIVIHPDKSSGEQFLNNPLLIESKGAVFYRVFRIKGYFISFIFALKKHEMANIGFYEFYHLMLQGINKYKRLKEVK